MGIFKKLKDSLSKTKESFVGKIENLFSGHKNIDEDLYEELEEILLQGDVGAEAALDLVDDLRQMVKERKITEPEQLRPILEELILGVLEQGESSLNLGEPPTVILLVGVNGVGKTTTIGKLAYYFKSQNKKVLLAAGDTFRAAACEQLEVWGNRNGVEVIKHQEGADPAAVVFDAAQAAKARKIDVLLVDTAGRLHTKSNLMEELKKISRVLKKEIPAAPHEVLLVLDATTGQNALSQSALFDESSGVTGIVLTKLDGTAKGGVVIGIAKRQAIPVKFVGIGEGIEDLRPFEAKEFIEALFEK